MALAERTGSLWEEYDEIPIADVALDLEAPVETIFSYEVPAELRAEAQPGVCVHVTLSGRDTLGYILRIRSLSTSDPLSKRLKPVQAVVPEAVTINAEQLQLAAWMSAHCVCDLQSALRCVAPAALGVRLVFTVRLIDPSLRGSQVGNSIAQAHIIETLRSLGGECEREKLQETAKLSSFSSAFSALIHKGLISEERAIERVGASEKKVKLYSLGPAAEIMGKSGLGRRSPQQQRILFQLQTLSRLGVQEMEGRSLLEAAEASAASLKGLLDKGILCIREAGIRRSPIFAPAHLTVPPPLSSGQQNAVERLKAALDTREFHTTLLFGVTASGKTEVYLQAIAHTLAQGRNAIVLLPEIALTAQVADVFVGRFGAQVAVLHSRLSEGERHDEWRRMQQNQARIVVGARSAIFAPMENVGLIVLDEEHEASYKQEKTPRYNARDLAAERARQSGSLLLLGSATPSLESYFASEEGSIERVEMRERIDNRPLPAVKITDMRVEFKQKPALFAASLVEAIADRIQKKEQTILFLNRRGYAQFVLCRDCGWTAKCPNCAVTLALHSQDNSLRCHHCDHRERAPMVCPQCQGSRVKGFGVGTERVEEETLNLFPEARIARLDRDTTSRKGSHSAIIKDFRKGDADILIGTQMVAKGLDFPNVTLVGVINADTSLNMPDFRAAERTFQLLTQVAGRAGRGVLPGEVILQTFAPEHYAIQAAIHHDYPSFYAQELVFRKELGYPPYRRFANLICGAEKEEHAKQVAERLSLALTPLLPQEAEAIGPAPAPLARLKNNFRYHVALRGPVETDLSALIARAIENLSVQDRQSITIDIDPLNMS